MEIIVLYFFYHTMLLFTKGRVVDMKFKINNKYFKWGLTAFLVIAAGISFYYVIFHNSDIIHNMKNMIGVVMPVVFGLIIAYLLTPILNSIEDKALNPLFDLCKVKKTNTRDKWVRTIGVIFTSVLLILLIYILIAMLVSQIVPSLKNIVNNFDNYINNIFIWLNKLLEDNQDLKSFVIPQVNKLLHELEMWLDDTAAILEKSTELVRTVSLSIISVLKTTWNFIIGFVISIYVLFSKEKFSAQGKKIIYAVFEADTGNHVLNSLRFVHRTFIGFISGKILDSIIIGILCFIGTSIMNTPYAVLISVIVGVTNVIPFFGPYLGAIPCAFLLLIVDLSNPMTCISFIIFIFILQQVDGNIIGPKILGGSTGLSGFWVIFSITVFGGIFGIMGMIIGVPIFAIIYAFVKQSVNKSLSKKKMPLDADVYLTLDSVDEHTGEIQEMTQQKKSDEKSTEIKKSKRFSIKKKENDADRKGQEQASADYKEKNSESTHSQTKEDSDVNKNE